MVERGGESIVDLGVCTARVRSADARLHGALSSTGDRSGEHPLISVRYDEHPWPRWWVNDVPASEHLVLRMVHRHLLDLALIGEPALYSAFAVSLRGLGILVWCPSPLRDTMLAALSAAGALWIAADAVPIAEDGTAISHRAPSLVSSSAHGVDGLVDPNTAIGGTSFADARQFGSEFVEHPAQRIDLVFLIVEGSEPEYEVTPLTAASTAVHLTDLQSADQFRAAERLLNTHPKLALVRGDLPSLRNVESWLERSMQCN